MLDITAPYSQTRIKQDIQELENLCELITQQNFHVDPQKLSEAFRELVSLAGSREFLPVYSRLFQYVSNLKWAREGKFETGYVVPWINLYSALRASQSTSHLVMIANRIQRNLPAHDQQILRINSFGNGCQPVDSNLAEWTKILDSVTCTSSFFSGQSFKSIQHRKRPIINQNPIRGPVDLKKSAQLPSDICSVTTVTNSPPKPSFQQTSPKIVKKRKSLKQKKLDLSSFGLEILIARNEWDKQIKKDNNQANHVAAAAGPDHV